MYVYMCVGGCAFSRQSHLCAVSPNVGEGVGEERGGEIDAECRGRRAPPLSASAANRRVCKVGVRPRDWHVTTPALALQIFNPLAGKRPVARFVAAVLYGASLWRGLKPCDATGGRVVCATNLWRALNGRHVAAFLGNSLTMLVTETRNAVRAIVVSLLHQAILAAFSLLVFVIETHIITSLYWERIGPNPCSDLFTYGLP